ncbi:hypothetical protein FACS1894200_14470 [Spirochaetia bacterium]|nr:hypothetical protein FACS1894200_14470 [Spirochaetia bacterium]
MCIPLCLYLCDSNLRLVNELFSIGNISNIPYIISYIAKNISYIAKNISYIVNNISYIL